MDRPIPTQNRRSDDYNAEACKVRHDNEEARMDKVESTLSKIFDKLDAFSQRPSWMVLTIISFLATGLGITMTIILRGVQKQ